MLLVSQLSMFWCIYLIIMVVNKFDISVSVTEEYNCSQVSARVHVLERHCECSPENYQVMASTKVSTHV